LFIRQAALVPHKAGEPIDIYLHCRPTAVSIEVCDRGPGIPSEYLEAVFRPFSRFASARARRVDGSGLGLAVANRLATKCGWTIDLLPRQGGGTIARLGLPPSNHMGSC
jgi:two-component system osmolarity sensor histidine kinase EnvZ